MRKAKHAVLTALLLAWGLPAAAQEAAPPNRASLAYSHVRFDTDFDPWHLVTAEAQRNTGAGPVIARLTLAERFGSRGEQLELEAYPRISERTYAYLGAGISGRGLFPDYRVGAELFGSLPSRLEVSAGARHLDFDGDGVTMYTGSFGAYRGKYYLSLRPYLVPRGGEVLASADLLVRRYLRTEDEFLTFRVGGGDSPADEFTSLDLVRLGSLRASLDGRVRLDSRFGLRLGAELEREELPLDRRRDRVTFDIGADVRF